MRSTAVGINGMTSNYFYKVAEEPGLLDLPDELILKICDMLPFPVWRILSRVNKRLRFIAHDVSLWKRYFSPDLDYNFTFNINILSTLRENPEVFKYAAEELKNDTDVVLAAVKKNPLMLQYAGSNCQDDRSIVFAAVEKNPLMLQYASSNCQNDRSIVSAAVRKFGMALRYASEELRDDKSIVFPAVRNCSLALEFASNRLRRCRGFILALVKNHSGVIAYSLLKNDERFIRAAMSLNQNALCYAKDYVRESIELDNWYRDWFINLVYVVIPITATKLYAEYMNGAEEIQDNGSCVHDFGCVFSASMLFFEGIEGNSFFF
ncbi:MAG: DUF4116 domain-containing protein [Pseudomonadota bacterium]|nr:DUF4116 domain-containing protein [Pseudomonadota bacterium]